MAEYNIYPSVDEKFNFPPEIRKSLTTSTEMVTALDKAYSTQLAPIKADVSAAADVLVNAGNVSGTRIIDLSLGNYHTLSLTGNTILSVINWPPTGVVAYVTLEIVSNGYTITWPRNWNWMGRVAPTLTSGATDLVSLSTRNAGSKVIASVSQNYGTDILPFLTVMQEMNPLYLMTLSEASGNFLNLMGGLTVGTPSGVIGRQATSLLPSDPSIRGISLNGINSYVSLNNNGPIPAMNPSKGSFSFAFSIKANEQLLEGSRVMYIGSAESTGALFSITPSTGNPLRLAVQLRDDSGAFILNMNAGTLEVLDGAAHFIVFTYSNGSWTWYLDGLECGTGVVATSNGSFTAVRNAIGAINRNTTMGFFNGSIQNVAAFTRRLTPSEITNAFNSWLGYYA